MTTVTFSNTAADMRVPDSYGVPALDAFYDYLSAFVLDHEQVISTSPTGVVFRQFDAQNNFIEWQISGNISGGQATLFRVIAEGVAVTATGTFTVTPTTYHVSGTVTQVEASPAGTNGLLLRIAGLSEQVNNALPDLTDDAALYAGADTVTAGSLSVQYYSYLIGYGGDDTLLGAYGHDTLDGGTGADSMSGGFYGDEVYIVDDEGDVVVDAVGGGDDAVHSSVTWTLGEQIETLVLTGVANINGTGNALANRIVGNAGVNNLAGGGANDTYVVNNAGDVVTEALDAGLDEIRSSVARTLEANVERLILTGSAGINGTGNALNNLIEGNSGANRLAGGGGTDSFAGGAGNDTYVIDSAGDTAVDTPLGTTIVSAAADGRQGTLSQSFMGGVSADGRLLAFASASPNLIPDSPAHTSIYVKNLETGEVTLASTNGDGERADNGSEGASFSSDGRYIAFEGPASNLVTGDTNNVRDIFVKDLQTGAVTRASTSSDGTQGNSISTSGTISGDGLHVAFQSNASNLVAGDLNASLDVFMKSLQTGATVLVSTSSNGTQANNSSYVESVSADGRYVSFTSGANNLVAGDTNGFSDVFVKDLQTGTTVLVSASADGTPASVGAIGGGGSMSADGRYVVFNTFAAGMVEADVNGHPDVFVKDVQTGAVVLASVAADGTLGNAGSSNGWISPDGRYVLFKSSATNLAPAGTNPELYVKDLQTGQLGWVSAAFVAGSASVDEFLLSPDGRQAFFTSSAANLVLDDENGFRDIFMVGNPLFDPGGTDTVESSVDHSLSPFIERLVLTGTAATNGTGNASANAITGNASANILTGRAGNDTLLGGGGEDVLRGEAGNDSLHGGAGFDWAYYDTANAAVKVTLVTGAVQNTLGAGSDSLAAIEGVFGTAYADNLAGNSAANALRGELGSDTLLGASGNDTLFGGDGDDIVRGDGGDDSLDAGAGADWAYYNGLAAGVSVNLTLVAAQNTVGGGTDTIAGVENVLGTSYADTLIGSDSANYLRGEVGNDTLNAGAGNDTLLGGDGNDTLRGELGNDSLHGGAGFDWAYYDTTNAAIKVTLVTGAVQNTLGAGSDSLASIEGVFGTAYADNLAGNSAANALRGELGNDTLLGASGNDTLLGGDGDDTVRGDGGDDSLDGGAGTDWAYYNGAAGAVTVSLALPTAQNTAGSGIDTLSNIENALGSSYADRLTGNSLANYLRGEVGNDTLAGGAGNDTFLGGSGADRFEYATALNAATNVERILDYSLADDLIALDNDVFSAFVTENVALTAAAFRSGAGITAAQDADDRIVYNTATGNLYYDSDGVGGAASILFATLANKAVLTAGDFVITG